MSNFNTFFTALVYSTLEQQIYWLWKILLVYTLQSTVLPECVQLKSRFITIKLYFSFTDLNRVPQEWVSSDILQFWCGLPILFINTNNYQQTYKIMGCFDTGKLLESGNRNGSVTPVWGGRLLVWIRFCRANMMTVADARRFVASRMARRSGIAAPLCHIWLPVAPLRQLASSYEHACKTRPALHLMHMGAWWNPDRVLGKPILFLWFFCLRHYQYPSQINCIANRMRIFSYLVFLITFPKNYPQNSNKGCIDASRRQLQSVIKFTV
jgi:hypothetical protein